MGAQTFNFAPKFSQNGGFQAFSPKFWIFERTFSDKKIVRQFTNTPQFRGGAIYVALLNCPLSRLPRRHWLRSPTTDLNDRRSDVLQSNRSMPTYYLFIVSIDLRRKQGLKWRRVVYVTLKAVGDSHHRIKGSLYCCRIAPVKKFATLA